MNLKFLKSLNEDHEKRMSSDEMKSYLELLYKKCSKKVQDEFNEYLKKECDVDEVDLAKCSEMLCKDDDRCDKVIHHLENLSEKLDENSLAFHISEQELDSPDMSYVRRLNVAAQNVWEVWQAVRHGYRKMDPETVQQLRRTYDLLSNIADKLERR
jgi:uncharacterized protein YaaN involved in tellurite resistance